MFLSFFFLFSAGFCASLPQSVSSETVLTSFFRDLIEETSAGYAIYGKKPLYLGDFSLPEWTAPGSKRHKDLNQCYLALNFLKQFPKNPAAKEYTLINNGNDLFKSYRFMIINRNAFNNVFEENLPLFKYKLGWNISFDTLIKQFESLNNNDGKSSKNEPALQGITLGYGTDNAISWERLRSFMNAAFSTTPQCPPKKLPPLPTTEEELSDRIGSIFKGSDWEKVKEETKDFSNHYIFNPEGNLKIFFAFHKGSEETQILLESYRKAQSMLDQLLSKKNFLNETLERLGIDAAPLSKTLSLPTKKRLSQILAKSVRFTFSERISSEFVAGWNDAINLSNSTSLLPDPKEVLFLKILDEKTFFSSVRREKTQESQALFQKIESSGGVSCLIPQKLYTRIIRCGKTKKQLTPNTKSILVNYLIKGVDGTPIGGTYKLEEPSKLNLEELIPGLAHGLIGMKEGEIREIYIHPDFAYGVHSEFGHGSALQVQVELIQIEEISDGFSLPYLQPIDVRAQTPIIKTCEDFKKLQKKYNYLCGIKTGLHYKKADNLINLNEVIELILSGDTQAPYTEQEREVISLLNWMIYQANSSEHIEGDW